MIGLLDHAGIAVGGISLPRGGIPGTGSIGGFLSLGFGSPAHFTVILLSLHGMCAS